MILGDQLEADQKGKKKIDCFGPFAALVVAFGFVALWRPYPTASDFCALVSLYCVFGDQVLPAPQTYRRRIRRFILSRYANYVPLEIEYIPSAQDSNKPTDDSVQAAGDKKKDDDKKADSDSSTHAGKGASDSSTQATKSVDQSVAKALPTLTDENKPKTSQRKRMVIEILGCFFGLCMYPVMSELWLMRNSGNGNFLFFMGITYHVFGTLSLFEFLRLTVTEKWKWYGFSYVI